MKIVIVLLTLTILIGCKPASKPKEYVSATELRLRSEPSQKGASLEILKFGAEVEVLAVSKENETINGITAPWKQVRYGEKEGWVFGGYLVDQSRYSAIKSCVDAGNIWNNDECRNPIAHAIFQRVLLTGGTSSHPCPNDYSRFVFYPDGRCENVSVSVSADIFTGRYSFGHPTSVTCQVSGQRIDQMTGQAHYDSMAVTIEVIDRASARIFFHNADGSNDERRLDISEVIDSGYTEVPVCFEN